MTGSLAGTAVSLGANALLGGGAGGGGGGDFPGFEGLYSPAFDIDVVHSDQGKFNITLNPEFRKAIEEFKRLSNVRADEISQLLPQVAPGIGMLTQARRGRIAEARERALGAATRDQARRGVRGSSFGQQTLADVERRFGQEDAAVTAQSFLEELTLTNEMMRERTNTLQQGVSTEMNARLGVSQVAVPAVTSLQGIMSSNARFLEEMRAQEAAGFGQLAGLIGSGVGDALSGLFKIDPIKISF